MTMLWVGVGAAVLGAGASVYGANKQAGAATKASNLNQNQNLLTRSDQMPFMQSGYGAMGKLNTLLGINPNPNIPRMMPGQGMPNPSAGPSQTWAPTQGGGVDPRMQLGPSQNQPPPHQWNVPEANMPNLQLRSILSLRAQHGDRQAQMMLQRLA